MEGAGAATFAGAAGAGSLRLFSRKNRARAIRMATASSATHGLRPPGEGLRLFTALPFFAKTYLRTCSKRLYDHGNSMILPAIAIHLIPDALTFVHRPQIIGRRLDLDKQLRHAL